MFDAEQQNDLRTPTNKCTSSCKSQVELIIDGTSLRKVVHVKECDCGVAAQHQRQSPTSTMIVQNMGYDLNTNDKINQRTNRDGMENGLQIEIQENGEHNRPPMCVRDLLSFAQQIARGMVSLV